MTPRRAFTLVELLLVAGIIGIFAGLVIPRFADTSRPPADPIARLLETDLRRARTEAMALGKPIVAVASQDGGSWWLSHATSPAKPIAGTERRFGSGGLAPMKGAKLTVKSDDGALEDGSRVFAHFDTLGSRDEGEPTLELRDRDGDRIASWTIPAGRTRFDVAR